MKRTPFAPELDARRTSVLPYIEMAATITGVDYAELDPFEIVAVTGLVSGAPSLQNSPEEALRFEIYTADRLHSRGELDDQRHLALHGIWRAASSLKKMAEPSAPVVEPSITLPAD
ncbi:MAG TPA: hypothetical protein VLG13_00780 [Patescibacteria group bacterium]|nr:hypothetical protein [Patescibacteria group bacterium]